MEAVTKLVKKDAKSMDLVLIKKKIHQSKYLIILFLPCLLYYIIFKYVPMYGLLMAFQKYKVGTGIWHSKWVGLLHFERFFSDHDSLKIVWNTFILNFYNLIWGFPAPIVLALLLNEIRSTRLKRTLQTLSYLPHFISEVIVVSILITFLSPSTGIINKIIEILGGEKIFFMSDPGWFRTLYVSSSIWKEVGWGAIIYMASLSGVDPEQYEAAIVDGANRWKQLIHVTLPAIYPTITILLILRVGHMLSIGFEKVLLMYNPLLYSTADVISTYVYRRGILQGEFSYSAAIGLLDSVVGLVLVVTANKISKKVNETSLW